MLTRTNFQNETGLTGKALRFHEAGSLLEWQEGTRPRPLNRKKDVACVILAWLLRQAGVSGAQIESDIKPVTVHDLWNDYNNYKLCENRKSVVVKGHDTLDLLDSNIRAATGAIQRSHHRGIWVSARSVEICKSRVPASPKTRGRAGVSGYLVAARYKSGCCDRVDITCCTETDPGDRLPASDGKPLFIREGIYLAMRTRGTCRRNMCFDAFNAPISRKPAGARSEWSRTPFEMDIDCFLDGVHGQPFDALILV